MLSAKQRGIKYHFLSLWYDSTLGLNPGLPGHWRTLLMARHDDDDDDWMVSTRPLISTSSSPFFKKSFGEFNKSTKYNWYNRHVHIPEFFQFPSKVEVFILLLTFFQFYSLSFIVWSAGTAKSTILQALFFFC